jgi:hypothetical protein
MIRYFNNRGRIRLILVVLSLLGLFTLLFFPSSEILARQVNLQDVLNGQVPGLTAVVRGSGRGWYGDSLQVFFENQTGETHSVKIPLGLRLVPEDTSVQTMITAGGETITISPGSSSSLIKAFCGEQHDHAPGTSDVFHPDGFVDSPLMETVRRINQSETYNSTAQDAVWNHTDNKDISENDAARDLAGSSGPSDEKAAGLAGLTAALILVWALTGGVGPEFTRIAGDVLHSITGRGGQPAAAVEPVTPTQPPQEESAVENTSSSPKNRPSEDHRRDVETESRVPVEDQNEKDLTQENLVYDGEKWVKPEIVIQHMKHHALEIESDSSSRQGLSGIWPDQEKNIGSNLSVPSRLISTVGEYNHQKVHMINLDKLLDTALEEKRQVVEALRQAESEGRTGMADYLRGQLEIADANLSKVNIARDNCSERIQAAADRIAVRGIGSTMNLGEKGASDVIGISKTVINAGRLTGNLIDQARRGNLPFQRGAFRDTSGSPSGDTPSGNLPTLRLNRGDRLFSSPVSQGSRPVPSETLKALSVDRGEVASRGSILSGARPTIESETGYTQLKLNADRAWKGETYRDMRVIRDTSSPHLGANNRRIPEYMRINPQGIQRAATRRRADPKAFEEMTKAHEYWHAQANLRYATNITTVPGDNISPNLLRLQEVSNQIRVEEGVMQHVRMDFYKGKLPGVTSHDFAAFEQYNDDVLAPLRAERDTLLLGLERSP